MGKDIFNLRLQLYVLGPAEEILAVMLTVRLSYSFYYFLKHDYGFSP